MPFPRQKKLFRFDKSVCIGRTLNQILALYFGEILGKYRILDGRLHIIYGSVSGKRDLLAIFQVIKYDVKCGTCLHKFDCRETTLSNAANHFKIFLIEFEICLYKHLYFVYIENPLFPIVVFISMLWQLKVNMFYPKNSFPIV